MAFRFLARRPEKVIRYGLVRTRTKGPGKRINDGKQCENPPGDPSILNELKHDSFIILVSTLK